MAVTEERLEELRKFLKEKYHNPSKILLSYLWDESLDCIMTREEYEILFNEAPTSIEDIFK